MGKTKLLFLVMVGYIANKIEGVLLFVEQNEKPLISVIVPVYNMGNKIRDCLNSILDQTYENFELILVDDGSTDSSVTICDEYASKNSNVSVIHIANSGPFQARKIGAEKAQGEIITFSDADDWMECNAFETAIQIFDKYNPDIFAYAYIYENNDIEINLYEEKYYCRSEIKNLIIPSMMFDPVVGMRRLNPSLCCKYIKKDIFNKVTHSITDRITLGEDALVSYPAVCMAESIFICNKALYHYSNNASSCTHLFPLERMIEVKAFQKNIMRLFEEMNVQKELRHQVESYVRTFLLMMIRNWYGMELSPIPFDFPFDYVVKGSKVIVYGAGDVGKSYINELKISGYADIVGWADRDYERIKSYNHINIIAPESIKGKTFDVLLIAIRDECVAYAIRNDLINMGINEKVIFWKKPVHII